MCYVINRCYSDWTVKIFFPVCHTSAKYSAKYNAHLTHSVGTCVRVYCARHLGKVCNFSSLSRRHMRTGELKRLRKKLHMTLDVQVFYVHPIMENVPFCTVLRYWKLYFFNTKLFENLLGPGKVFCTTYVISRRKSLKYLLTWGMLQKFKNIIFYCKS